MANVIEITDFSAPELDVYARLTEAQLLNRFEPAKGMFIAESPKVIHRALDGGCEPVSMLMERKDIDGSAAEILQLMRSHYAGKGVFLEIESVYEECDNKAERIRRKHFYEKCGMTSMEEFVWLFGVKMELMGFDCKLSYEQYHAFYRDNYNQWAADHIQKAEK